MIAVNVFFVIDLATKAIVYANKSLEVTELFTQHTIFKRLPVSNKPNN